MCESVLFRVYKLIMVVIMIHWIWTSEGFMYLSTIMDLFSRKIITWECNPDHGQIENSQYHLCMNRSWHNSPALGNWKPLVPQNGSMAPLRFHTFCNFIRKSFYMCLPSQLNNFLFSRFFAIPTKLNANDTCVEAPLRVNLITAH